MEPSTRQIAICIFSNGGKILVHEARDEVKGETFFRPLGGGIEPGETAEGALRREIREELGLDVENLRLLGSLENRFVFRGEKRHEVCSVFDGEFVDKSAYQRDFLEVIGMSGSGKAVWKSVSDFRSGESTVYPTGILNLI